MKHLRLAIALFFTLSSLARAQSGYERVSFASLDKGFKGQLTATIYLPAGSGPFPAMVLLHTCAGIQPFVFDWAKWFVDNGYEAIVVDSFGPRGIASVCGVGGYPDERARAYDAYGALAYLRTRSDVDGARIGMIGWSHGGGTVLAADDKGLADAQAGGNGFRAAIALYPPCQFMPRSVSAPLLLLLGAADDWAPPGSCDRDVGRLARAGSPVSDHIYPGTTHAFDNPSDRGVTHIHGHIYTLNYNPDAAQDAHARVAAFLTESMK